jgi:phosphoribosylaminoimidazolecarboxamide formyltransferase / IMP cyclohydrolase
VPKAILSVYAKSGLVDFGRGLRELGWDLIASGGTARLLSENGLAVTEVADYTGSPEILDGRVKTLHPAIHAGLLARDSQTDLDQLKEFNWAPIDLVAANLYPFEQTIQKPDANLQDAIENIDIGGVALIRAAAKNFERVALVCDPADYQTVLDHLRKNSLTLEIRRTLAVKGFLLTAQYDAAISAYLQGQAATLELRLYPVSTLRYGENPHQSATLYNYRPDSGPLGGQLLQGKALSYNNLLDLDAAWRAAVSFDRPTVCIVKHLSPCGIASADSLGDAFGPALASDPVSAFGGVIAVNRRFDANIARALGPLFVECIAAPGFSDESLEILSSRKNLRLVAMPDPGIEPLFEFRSIHQGMLRQSVDLGDPPGAPDWKVVTRRMPEEAEWQSLRFAWKACQHVKSNAIVMVQGQATVGIGGGQPNRVNCVRIAAERAGEKSKGAVMASDAFFPFPDSVEEAARAGITAIVAPGGSIRDAQSISTADSYGLAMVFTGVRHFRH